MTNIITSEIPDKQKGVAALVIMAFLGTIMGVWVRFLGDHFELYQQVSARALAGFIIGFIFYRNRLRLKAIAKAPVKDILLLLLRSFVLVIGIGLFTASILNTKLANVNFVFSLPTTALLGVIFLKEKLTLKKSILLLSAFIGVVFVSVDDYSNIFSWGYGETLALISTFFYSFSYIIRKWLTKSLNNEEIASIGSFFSFCIAFLFSQLFGNGISEFASTPPFLIFIVILAGATFLLLNYLWSYGFEKVEAIVANNMLVLGSVFGLLIGFLAYQEIPIFREIIGGFIILTSAIYMNKIQSA